MILIPIMWIASILFSLVGIYNIFTGGEVLSWFILSMLFTNSIDLEILKMKKKLKEKKNEKKTA